MVTEMPASVPANDSFAVWTTNRKSVTSSSSPRGVSHAVRSAMTESDNAVACGVDHGQRPALTKMPIAVDVSLLRHIGEPLAPAPNIVGTPSAVPDETSVTCSENIARWLADVLRLPG